ncbi:MAG: VCBS repeat-containing protein, partial [Sphingobacteriales bacterium]
VSVFRNISTPGSIAFGAALVLTAGDKPESAAIGDFDGDGKPDIAVANSKSNIVHVFQNTTSGSTLSFAAKVDLSADGKVRNIAAADMDGDGKVDIVTAVLSTGTASVFRNIHTSGSISTASFAAKSVLNTLLQDVNIVDIDGDGRPDIAGTNKKVVTVLRYNPFATKISDSFNGQILSSIDDAVTADVVSSASMYRFRITEGDNVQTIDAETNSFKFTQLNSYENSTSYSVDVKVEVAGTWMDYGTVSVVTTPFPITQISESFSGKTLLNTDSVITADPVSSATGYRLRVTKDATVQTLDAPTNEFKLKELGDYDYNTTYSVDVAVKKGAAVGSFGAASLLSTPTAPITQLMASYCGANLTDVDGFVRCDALPLATAYQFRVRLGDSVKVIDELVPSTLLYKTNFYSYGTTYTVDVSALVDGTWSAWGAACQVTSWASPRTQLSGLSCGKTLNPVGDIFADNVPTATNYRFKITQGAIVQYIESTVQGVWLSDIPGYAYNTTYSIEVSAKVKESWTPYGAACNVTTGPAITQITPPDCGRILTDVIGSFRADRLPTATAYRFEVTQGSNVGFIEETIPATLLFKTNFYAYNTTYSVRVSALLNDTWTAYGPACNVTSMPAPYTQLSLFSCGTVLNKDGDIHSDGVPTATAYRFQITQGTNPPQTVNSPDVWTKLANMPGYAFSTVYSVETAALVKDVWTPYGVACNVTTAARSANSNLSALTITTGTLSPVFTTETQEYTASVS